MLRWKGGVFNGFAPPPAPGSSFKAWTLNTGARKAVFGKLIDMERHLFANGARDCECIIRW